VIILYDITLHQMEYFLKVTELQSFSKAAKALFIAQPTVSKRIRSLETELEIKLFIRNGRTIELTPEGKYLYDEWEAIVRTIHSSIKTASAIRDGTTGLLKIGCLNAVNYDHFLPKLIHDYEKLYPGATVEISAYGFREIRELLLNGSIDLAFTTTFDMENIPGISQKAVEEHRAFIAVPASHHLGKAEQVRLIDLKNETFYFVSPKEVRYGPEYLLAACRNAGLTPRNIQYVPNFFSLALAIKQGKGVAICSKDIIRGNEEYIRLFHTEEVPNDVFNIIAWRTENVRSLVLRFLEMISKVKPSGGYE
jgi:DNA-binding transcriptional LysR family regulator